MRLMKHNPAFLTDDELASGFVVRHSDMELLLERIRDNRRDSNQHLLIIGPRGMGKTTLALRIAAAVSRDLELSQWLFPLAFGEESYEVGTAAEFWLEALFHLGERTSQVRFQRMYHELKAERNEQRLYDQALGRLLDFADEQGKRLLIIVENLNQILGEQLTIDEGWKLRHTLLNEPRIMLLATALSRFDGIDRVDQPMYDLFWVHELQALTQDECRTLWHSITGHEEHGERIRPVQILTGGNPRLLSILASFAAHTSLHDLMLELEQLVDDNTNYFKSYLESLPAAERKIYVTLADIWGPVTAREIAESARVEVNSASALLHRLVRRGAVAEIKDNRSRKIRYQISERLYNIYHLMRRRGDVSSRVKAATHFMVGLYRGPELINATSRIASEACQLDPEARRDHFQAYCDILRHPASSEIRDQILRTTDARFFDLEDAPPLVRNLGKRRANGKDTVELTPKKTLTIAELRHQLELDSENLRHWIALARQLEQDNSFSEAADAYREALRRDPNAGPIWFLLGILLHFEIKDYKGAEDAYLHGLQGNPNDDYGWFVLGNLRRYRLEKLEGAIEAYKKSIAIKPRADVYLALAVSLIQIKRYHEAEMALQEATHLQPNDAHILYHYSELFSRLNKFNEAELMLRKSIELEPSNARAWYELGVLLQLRLNRKNEAEIAFREALKIDTKDHNSWAALASLLSEIPEKILEAEEASRHAIETHPDCQSSWSHIEDLFAKQPTLLAQLEPLYRELSIKHPGSGWPLGLLGILSEYSLHDKSQAESLYLKAISVDSENPVFFKLLFRVLISRSEPAESILQTAEARLRTAKRTPDFLNELAWNVYAAGHFDLYAVAETWAREAAERDPSGAKQHTLASLLAGQNKWEDALSWASRFLEDTRETQRSTGEVIDFFVDAAAKGHAVEALPVLRNSKSRTLLEPLEVALQMILGEPHHAPQEIAEIAQDVVRRIHAKQAASSTK